MNKKIIFGVLIVTPLVLLATNSKEVSATTRNDFEVYTNNCPGTEDWKHRFREGKKTYHFFYDELTNWYKKDANNDMIITYSSGTSGNITYTTKKSSDIHVGGELFNAAMLEASSEIETSISYSIGYEESESISYTVSPDEEGDYYCIGLNYEAKKYTVDHYKQKFKFFGQGEYEYKKTSTIYIPTQSYVAKNYKLEGDDTVYES